ncbi:MAG: ATP-binding protein [Lactobacillaceae bacterium]|jgi:predicted AAA+ superfamily ATPase|nr:ATP-binding protein [Lactobacillaceae bacterium]
MKLIERPKYLKELIQYKDQPVIKVITGARRVGKSTIRGMYFNYLLNNDVQESNIFRFNLDDIENSNLLEAKSLYDSIVEKIDTFQKYYVILDEIQVVQDWQKVVNSLLLKGNIDVTISGSNAYLLSGELGTFLTGRYVSIKVLPLSFLEYSNFFDTQNEDRLFAEYQNNSALPQAVNFRAQNISDRVYLEDVLNNILFKDVVERYSIRDISKLQRLLAFIAESIGSQLSINNISNVLKNEGLDISQNTIADYLSALKNSFLIYALKRFNISGKNVLRTNEKHYIVDLGIKMLLTNKASQDVGKNLENTVFLELLRRYSNVMTGEIDGNEVDFIVEDGDKTKIEYFQVTETMRDEKTRERELKSLQLIKDSYPKTVLSMDLDPVQNIDGIRIVNLVDWLLGR